MEKELERRYSKIKIGKNMVITIGKQHEEVKGKELFFTFFLTHNMNLRCSHSLLLLEKDLTENQT